MHSRSQSDVDSIKRRNPHLADVSILLPGSLGGVKPESFDHTGGKKSEERSFEDGKPGSLHHGKKSTTTPLGTSTAQMSPYPIIGATFVGPASGAPFGVHQHNFSRLEMTPLYIGQLHTRTLYNQGSGEKRRGEGGLMTDERVVSGGGHMNAVRIGGAVEPFAWSGVRRGSGGSKTGSEAWKGLPEGQTSAVLKGIPSPDPGEINVDI